MFKMVFNVTSDEVNVRKKNNSWDFQAYIELGK